MEVTCGTRHAKYGFCLESAGCGVCVGVRHVWIGGGVRGGVGDSGILDLDPHTLTWLTQGEVGVLWGSVILFCVA